MNHAEGAEAVSSFISLVGPLACFVNKGLRDFYAQPVSPWKRSFLDPFNSPAAIAKVELELKERAERLVMRERYLEPYSGPRKDPPISNWAYPNPFL